jgi:hypothetical protein
MARYTITYRGFKAMRPVSLFAELVGLLWVFVVCRVKNSLMHGTGQRRFTPHCGLTECDVGTALSCHKRP